MIQQSILLLHNGESHVQFSAQSASSTWTEMINSAPDMLWTRSRNLYILMSVHHYNHGGRLISYSSTQLTTMLTPIIGRVFLLNYKQYSSVSGSHWTTMLDWVINFIHMKGKTKTPSVTSELLPLNRDYINEILHFISKHYVISNSKGSQFS